MTTTRATSLDGQTVRAESQEPTFYARVPKMVTDDLGPYELSLYVHYKQIAADTGSCYMSNRNLAKACGMSVSRLQQARGELERRHLITVTAQDSATGSLPPVVTIRDVWDINHQRYAVSSVDGAPTLRERVGAENQPGTRQKTGGLPPENNKEEPIQEKELEITAPQAAAVPSPSVEPKLIPPPAKVKSPRPPNDHQLMTEAVCNVMGMPVGPTMKSRLAGRIGKVASALRAMGIGTGDLPDLHAYVTDLARAGKWSEWGVECLETHAGKWLGIKQGLATASTANVTSAQAMSRFRIVGAEATPQ